MKANISRKSEQVIDVVYRASEYLVKLEDYEQAERSYRKAAAICFRLNTFATVQQPPLPLVLQ